MIKRIPHLWALSGALALALTAGACSSSDGNTNLQSRLRSLTGSVGGLGGSTKAKISAIVGSGEAKRQIPATLDSATGQFRFEDLPPGPKSIVVEQGGTSRTVKFGLSKETGKRTAVIPETQLAKESFDLGDLTMAATGDYVTAERNPLEMLIDTDGDGLFDFFDEDIDGDGLFNWDDEAFFGEWEDYSDWGWDAEDFYVSDWDCDGDGYLDWEDWSDDLSADVCGWEEDWDSYWEDEYWETYDDGYWEDYDECLEYPELCEGGEYDECLEYPELCEEWEEDWEDDGSEEEWPEEF